MTWPIPSSILRASYTGNTIEYASSVTGPKDIVERSCPYPMTNPLPTSCRPSSPPVILASQPPCAQLTMYRHQQYIKYYQDQQLKHEKKIARLESMRHLKKSSPPAVPCYARIFSSQNPVTPSKSSEERFRFPDVVHHEEYSSGHYTTAGIKRKEGNDIGSMLAELRVGTME